MSKPPPPPGPQRSDTSRAGEIAEFLVEAVGSTILTGGQWLLSQMKHTLGEGTPEDGRAFGVAGKRLRATDDDLGAAVPAGDWVAASSDAYADQNSRQRVRAASLADTDHEVHRLLAGEAYQVDYHRRKIDELYNWLGELSQYTEWLELIPRYGEAAKVAVETTAVQTALASAGLELGNMHQEAAQNAATLRDLVGRYRAIAAAAVLPDGDFGGPPRPQPGAPRPRSAGSVSGADLGAGRPDPMGSGGWAATADTAADTAAEPTQRQPTAGLAGLVGMAGLVPAMAAALTTPLGALVAPAGGLLAGVLQAAAQGTAAARQRDDATGDEDGAAGPAGADGAVPAEVIEPSAEDAGPGGSDTATVNRDNMRVSGPAAPPSATGR